MGRTAIQVAAVLAVTSALAAPAAAQELPGAERYADRLAQNARKADTDHECLVLRSVDLCGWRLRLVKRATNIAAEVGCGRHDCWYEWTGETATTRFFCRGYMAYHPHMGRWLADQSVDCYSDDDPSWFFTDDGVLVRQEPGTVSQQAR